MWTHCFGKNSNLNHIFPHHNSEAKFHAAAWLGMAETQKNTRFGAAAHGAAGWGHSNWHLASPPSGNQSWLTGKSLIIGGLMGKIIYKLKNGGFSIAMLPQGKPWCFWFSQVFPTRCDVKHPKSFKGWPSKIGPEVRRCCSCIATVAAASCVASEVPTLSSVLKQPLGWTVLVMLQNPGLI